MQMDALQVQLMRLFLVNLLLNMLCLTVFFFFFKGDFKVAHHVCIALKEAWFGVDF